MVSASLSRVNTSEPKISYRLQNVIGFDPDLFKANPRTLGLKLEDLGKAYDIKETELNAVDKSTPEGRKKAEYLERVLGKIGEFYNRLEKGRSLPIEPHHWEEWVIKSKVDPILVILNVTSVRNRGLISRLLGFPYSQDKPLGWYFQGLCLETKELSDTATHFKPDHPVYLNGRSCKYLCTKGKEIDTVYLDTGDDDYWDKILNSNIPVATTEGGKKGASGISHGVPTIILLGTWMGVHKVDTKVYIPVKGLQAFIRPDRPILLAFDADLHHKESVHQALCALGKAIEDRKGVVRVVIWPYTEETKGMDDFIATLGIEMFRKQLEKNLTLPEYVKYRQGLEKYNLRQDLIEYFNATDPIDKAFSKAEILEKYSHLKLNPRDLDNMANHIVRVEHGKSTNIDPYQDVLDFLNDETISKPEYIVDDWFVRKTCNILYGDSGLGKSILSYHLVKAIACKGSWLGSDVLIDNLKALIIQSDEDSSTTKERLERLGFDECPKGSVTIWDKRHDWSYNELDKLEKALIDKSFDMVIIDNLLCTKPSHLEDLSKNNAYEFLIKPLNSLAEKYNCTFLLLNHTPKNNKNQFLGSTALKALVYGMIELSVRVTTDKDGNEVNDLILKEVKARNHAPKSFTVNLEHGELIGFTKETGKVTSAIPREKKTNNKDKVVECINSFIVNEGCDGVTYRGKRPFTVKQLVGWTEASRSTVQKELKGLKERGLLTARKKDEDSSELAYYVNGEEWEKVYPIQYE